MHSTTSTRNDGMRQLTVNGKSFLSGCPWNLARRGKGEFLQRTCATYPVLPSTIPSLHSPVVCQDTSEIWMARKEDAVHVPCLSLVPVQEGRARRAVSVQPQRRTRSRWWKASMDGGRERTDQSAPLKIPEMLGTGETSSA